MVDFANGFQVFYRLSDINYNIFCTIFTEVANNFSHSRY